MYLIPRLRQIYETTTSQSIENNIAKCILLNLNHIDTLSLTDISKNTAISKSAVSNFISNLSEGGGYSMFKLTLQREIKQMTFEKKVILKHAKEYEDYFIQHGFQYVIQPQEVKSLAKQIKNANRIAILGDLFRKGAFNMLINYLLFQKKDIRYLNCLYPSDFKNECMTLNEEDLILFVEPDYTYFEFALNSEIQVDIRFKFEDCKAQKVYIGKQSTTPNEIETIAIKKTSNMFLDNEILELLASQILYYYILDTL